MHPKQVATHYLLLSSFSVLAVLEIVISFYANSTYTEIYRRPVIQSVLYFLFTVCLFHFFPILCVFFTTSLLSPVFHTLVYSSTQVQSFFNLFRDLYTALDPNYFKSRNFIGPQQVSIFSRYRVSIFRRYLAHAQ